MTTTLALLVSVPLLFQNVAARICPANQIISSSSNVCYLMTDSGYPASISGDLPDMELLDMDALEYQSSTWIDSSTLWTFGEQYENGTTTCSVGIDGDSPSPYPCPSTLQ